MRRSHLLPALLLLAAAALASGCTKRSHETRAFQSVAEPVGVVILESADGAVHLEVDPLATRVHGELDITASGYRKQGSADQAVQQVRVVESGTPDQLVLTIQAPASNGFRAVNVDVNLRIPPGIAVSAFALSGPVRLVDLPVLDVETTDGAVDLLGTEGVTKVRAEASPVAVDGHVGDLDVRTTLADVSLYSIRGNVRGQTTEGFVEARVVPPLGGEVILSTTRNGIDLALPYDFGAMMAANTVDGEIYIDGLDFHPSYSQPGTLEGQLWDGAGFVDVRTTFGDVRLHSR